MRTKKMIFYASIAFLMVFSVLIGWRRVLANSAPTVLSSYINDTVFTNSDSYPSGTINSLSAGGTRAVYLNGVVEDLDGNIDIDSVKGVLYRSGVAQGYNCSSDRNDCYIVSSCITQTDSDPNQKNYSCAIPLYYFSDATDNGSAYPSENWLVYIEVDDGLTTGNLNTTAKEMGGLLALDIPVLIDFNTMNLGTSTTTANDQEIIITQEGNTAASVTVSSPDANFTCSVRGTIPRANQEWSLTSFNHGAGTDLTGTPVEVNLNVPRQTDEVVAPNDSLYWGLAIPESGLEGVCTNTVVITAAAQ